MTGIDPSFPGKSAGRGRGRSEHERALCEAPTLVLCMLTAVLGTLLVANAAAINLYIFSAEEGPPALATARAAAHRLQGYTTMFSGLIRLTTLPGRLVEPFSCSLADILRLPGCLLESSVHFNFVSGVGTTSLREPA